MQSASPQAASPVAGAPERLIGRVLEYASWAFLAAAVGFCAISVGFILRYYRRMPFWDHWVWLARYNEAGLPGVLFTQFNEHRIVFPSFFFLADYELFAGSNLFLTIVILLLQAFTAAVLIAPLWSASAMPRALARVLSGVAAGLVLWLIQGENLLWPFQLHTLLANTAALGAIAAFSIYLRGGGRRAWFAAIALGTVASFSFAHGMLVWPVLVVLAFGARVPFRRILWLIATFAILLAIYLTAYRTPSGHSSPLASLAHPAGLIHYVVVFLALPAFGPGRGDLIGVNLPAYLAGGSGLLAAAVYIVRYILTASKSRRQQDVIYTGAMLLVIAAAFVTGLGRLGMSAAQALSSRYGTLSIIFWIALLAALTVELARWEAGSRGAGRLLWSLMLLGGTVMVTRAQLTAMHDYAVLERERTAATLSLLAGVPDGPAVMRLVYPDPPLVEALRPGMERGRKFYYGWPVARQLQRPLSEIARVADPAACRGAFDIADSYTPVATALSGGAGAGIHALGWAWDRTRNAPPASVLFTDSARKVTGAAMVHVERPDVAATLGDAQLRPAGWVGYARAVPGDGVDAWAIVASGEACLIMRRTPLPRKQ
jgi:hypothetical protein